MQIYLINLKQNTDRAKLFFENLPLCLNKNQIKIFEAINGYQDSPPHWFKTVGNLFGRYGCYMSHLEILKKINETTLILEDDCVFNKNFSEKYTEIIKKIKYLNYDIFYLGGKHIIKPIGITDIKLCKKTILTHSYIVNKNSAKKIVSLLENKYTWKYYLHNNYEIDLLYAKLQSDNILKAYCIDPWIVNQNRNFKSTTKNLFKY